MFGKPHKQYVYNHFCVGLIPSKTDFFCNAKALICKDKFTWHLGMIDSMALISHMFFYAISIFTPLITVAKMFTEIAITACPHNINFYVHAKQTKKKERKKMKIGGQKKKIPLGILPSYRIIQRIFG